MTIIDGYNVIGAAGEFGLTLAQEDKEVRLLRLLAAYRSGRRGRGRFLVVFDGHHGRLVTGPRRYLQAGIEVEWAIGESADDLILRRVRGAGRPRDVEVVTSDLAVQRSAATWGARSTRSQDFLARLRAGRGEAGEAGEAEKPAASSPAEIDEWLERFGE